MSHFVFCIEHFLKIFIMVDVTIETIIFLGFFSIECNMLELSNTKHSKAW